eukprot:EG_transcript_5030
MRPAAPRESSPPLPVGWEKKWDEKHRRYYYINHIDKSTTWTAPPPPPVVAAPPPRLVPEYKPPPPAPAPSSGFTANVSAPAATYTPTPPRPAFAGRKRPRGPPREPPVPVREPPVQEPAPGSIHSEVFSQRGPVTRNPALSLNEMKANIPENPKALLHPDVQGKLDYFLAHGPFGREDVDQRFIDILADVPPIRAINCLEYVLNSNDTNGVKNPSAYLVTMLKKREFPPPLHVDLTPPLLVEPVQALVDNICIYEVLRREDFTQLLVEQLSLLGAYGAKALCDFLAADLDRVHRPALLLQAIVNVYCEEYLVPAKGAAKTDRRPPRPVESRPPRPIEPYSEREPRQRTWAPHDGEREHQGPPAHTNAAAMPTEPPTYQTILHPGVQARLDTLFAQRLMLREEVDEWAIQAIASLPPMVGFNLLQFLRESDIQGRIRNKSAYIKARVRNIQERGPGKVVEVDLDQVAAEEAALPYEVQVKLDECFEKEVLIRQDVPQEVIERLGRLPEATALDALGRLLAGEADEIPNRSTRLLILIDAVDPEGANPEGYSQVEQPPPSYTPTPTAATPAQGQGKPDKRRQLYVTKLPQPPNADFIRAVFNDFGTVVDVKVVGVGAFVRYETHEECQAAIRALHNITILEGATEPLQLLLT